MVLDQKKRFTIMESDFEEKIHFGKRSTPNNQKDSWVCPAKKKRLNLIKTNQRRNLSNCSTSVTENWVVNGWVFGHCQKTEAFWWRIEQKVKRKDLRNWRLLGKIQKPGWDQQEVSRDHQKFYQLDWAKKKLISDLVFFIILRNSKIDSEIRD